MKTLNINCPNCGEEHKKEMTKKELKNTDYIEIVCDYCEEDIVAVVNRN